MHGLLTVRPANAFVREVVRGRQAPVATQVHPIHEMQRLFSVRRRFAAIAQPAASVALAATTIAQPAAAVTLAASSLLAAPARRQVQRPHRFERVQDKEVREE